MCAACGAPIRERTQRSHGRVEVPKDTAGVACHGGEVTGRVWWDESAWFWVTVVDGRSLGGEADSREDAENALRTAEEGGHDDGPRLRIVR